ncbi:MAG: TlpA disulfide reductase family protein [Myxococcota bacterium]
MRSKSLAPLNQESSIHRRTFIRHLTAGSLAALTLGPTGVAMALSRGSRAPEIGLRDIEGRNIRIGALRGKVVLVDFWASWCDPCRDEMPFLNGLYRRYREQGLVVIGVSVDREERNMRRFLRRNEVSFPVVHDEDQEVAGRYEPPTMPSSYLVDRRGVVRYIHEGFRSGDSERIERAVGRQLQNRGR